MFHSVRYKVMASGALLGAALAAHAGSVITTNLPAGTAAIVNIDARNDGAKAYDGDQSNWFQPFAVDNSPTELTLGPGTYTFDLTDPADAASAFPDLTTSQLDSIYTAWSWNTPWGTDYFVFDSSALTDSNQSQLFCGAISPTTYPSAQQAYDGARSGGYASQIHVGSGGRYHAPVSTSLTLLTTETLVWVVPDYDLSDNSAGVSVVVHEQPVPEPAPLAVLGLGLVGIAIRRRRSPR